MRRAVQNMLEDLSGVCHLHVWSGQLRGLDSMRVIPVVSILAIQMSLPQLWSSQYVPAFPPALSLSPMVLCSSHSVVRPVVQPLQCERGLGGYSRLKRMSFDEMDGALQDGLSVNKQTLQTCWRASGVLSRLFGLGWRDDAGWGTLFVG